MVSYRILFLYVLLIFFEQSKVYSNDFACKTFSTPTDVLECALQNHPDLKRANAGLQQGERLESIAEQRPNPELSTRGAYGRLLGDTVFNMEINLTHTFELGGKRGSRIEKAKAEKEIISASRLKTKEEVFLETLKTLYRLRQVQVEARVLEEALTTFSKIQKQFRSRTKLGPDQQVSLGVFQIAEEDYKLRKAVLETENESLLKTLGLILNQPFEPNSKLYPKKKMVWPDFPEAESMNPLKGSAIRLFEADLQSAQANLSQAQSQSWPDLRIGPSLDRQTQGPFTYYAYGLNLTFNIPLFQANSAGRAFARSGLERAEQSLELRQRELKNLRQVLFLRYSKAVKALSKSISLEEIEKKHQNVEALFGRGLIQSSLVIEAHRQIIDFTKNQNEIELSAVEALWQIYALEGRMFEEKL